jgi:hypothetical protein
MPTLEGYPATAAAGWHRVPTLEGYPATAAAGWHRMPTLEGYPATTAAGWHRMPTLEGKLLRRGRRNLTCRSHRHCRQCNRKQPHRIAEFHLFSPVSCNRAQNGTLKVVAGVGRVGKGPVSLAWRSKIEVTLKLIP